MKTCLSSRIFILLFVCALVFVQYPHASASPPHAPKFDLEITEQTTSYDSHSGYFSVVGQVVNLGTYSYQNVIVTMTIPDLRLSSTTHCWPPFLGQGEVCSFGVKVAIGTTINFPYYSITANGE